MRGLPSPDYKDYRLEFGTYVLVTDRTTNTPRARAFGAIALHPTGSRDQSYRFMSLGTGEVINRAPGYWTEVVISDTVIGRVEALAKHQGQPMIQDSNLMVEYSPDQPIKYDKYDGDYEPADGQDSDEESLDDSVVSIIQEELSNDEDMSTADPQRKRHHIIRRQSTAHQRAGRAS